MNGESTNEDWANCATGQMGIKIAFAAGQMEIGPMGIELASAIAAEAMGT